MKQVIILRSVLLSFAIIVMASCAKQSSLPLPALEKRGNSLQLIADGKPFLVLGGELHNSSSSSREYMKEYWPKLKASGMNTVLAAVEWSLIEPEEGKYDFTLIDGLLQDARSNNLKLILLWFGTWKNSQSHYIPEWMKADFKRFPRVKAGMGKSLEIVTPFCKEAMDADAKAFSLLMKQLKEVDSSDRTVLMMQVENEVGVLGSPRDHGCCKPGIQFFSPPGIYGLPHQKQG